MKILLVCLLSFVLQHVFGQSHMIKIDSNGRVASLLMTPKEYDRWKTNYDYGNQKIREALFKDIYKKFEDDFDFIFLILNEDKRPSNMPSGELKQVANKVDGIGLGKFNDCNAYGSAGKLQSVIHLARFNYMRLGPSLHELMHNWGNFGIKTHALFEFGSNLNSFEFIPHWGFTGGSTKGQLGGFKQNTLKENGNNTYTVGAFGCFANGGNSVPYNELELYLMGMIPIDQVGDFDVIKSITSQIDNKNGTYTFTALTRETYSPEIMESKLGQRLPSSSNAQRDFKALALVITDTPLTKMEWKAIDDDIFQFSKNGPDNQSSIYNFWEATRELGTIEFGNLFKSVRDTSSKIVKVNKIIVEGENNDSAIEIGEQLQMMANVFPSNANNKKVAWSVYNKTGSADIDTNGLLRSKSIGTVLVTAMAQDNSNVVGQKSIEIYKKASLGDYRATDDKIFPNPTEKTLTIVGRNISEIRLFDINGKEMDHLIWDYSKGRASIKLEKPERGMYILSYRSSGIRKVKKVVFD